MASVFVDLVTRLKLWLVLPATIPPLPIGTDSLDLQLAWLGLCIVVGAFTGGSYTLRQPPHPHSRRRRELAGDAPAAMPLVGGKERSMEGPLAKVVYVLIALACAAAIWVSVLAGMR